LRTEEHGRERGLPSDGLVACTRVRLAVRQGPGWHGGAAETGQTQRSSGGDQRR
jgi:hypothetical protein